MDYLKTLLELSGAMQAGEFLRIGKELAEECNGGGIVDGMEWLKKCLEEGSVERTRRGLVWWYHLPGEEPVIDEVTEKKVLEAIEQLNPDEKECRMEDGAKWWTSNKIAEKLKAPGKYVRNVITKMEKAGKVKVVDESRAYGKTYPWFQLVGVKRKKTK